MLYLQIVKRKGESMEGKLSDTLFDKKETGWGSTSDTEKDCGFKAEVNFAEGCKMTMDWLKTVWGD